MLHPGQQPVHDVGVAPPQLLALVGPRQRAAAHQLAGRLRAIEGFRRLWLHRDDLPIGRTGLARDRPVLAHHVQPRVLQPASVAPPKRRKRKRSLNWKRQRKRQKR